MAPSAHSNPFDVTSLGEIMVRLSVPNGERLDDTDRLDVEIGGAEGNLSIALARLGRRVSWLSSLPTNPLGEYVLRTLRADGVDVSGVRRTPSGRMGLYFIEYATAPRSITVTYDRADSAAARMTSADVDWDILLNSRIIHLTGITPALSPSCLEVTRESFRRAVAQNVPISFDVNFRGKLWSAKAAAASLRPFVEGAQVLFCKSADAELLFGCTGSPEERLRKLSKLTGAASIFLTCGEAGAGLLERGEFHWQPAVPAAVVDRIGSGDAFAAGALHGLLDGDPRLGLQRGAALASIALSQHGDRVLTSPQELDSVIARGGSDVSR